jgi:hypothetical protein
MLNTETKNTYNKLKRQMNAAYSIFKKEPSLSSATRYTDAANTFKAFCVDTMASLVEDPSEDPSALKSDIAANIDKYKTCRQCGRELLYPIDTVGYIASSDFLEEFPGWCQSCLVEHCCSHDCELCTVTNDPSTCSFKETKQFYLE